MPSSLCSWLSRAFLVACTINTHAERGVSSREDRFCALLRTPVMHNIISSRDHNPAGRGGCGAARPCPSRRRPATPPRAATDGACSPLRGGVHRPPFDELKPFAIARATRRRETLGPGASSRPLPTPLPSRRRGPRGGRRTPRGVVMGSVPLHELFVKWNETDTCVMESREFT